MRVGIAPGSSSAAATVNPTGFRSTTHLPTWEHSGHVEATYSVARNRLVGRHLGSHERTDLAYSIQAEPSRSARSPDSCPRAKPPLKTAAITAAMATGALPSRTPSASIISVIESCIGFATYAYGPEITSRLG